MAVICLMPFLSYIYIWFMLLAWTFLILFNKKWRKNIHIFPSKFCYMLPRCKRWCWYWSAGKLRDPKAHGKPTHFQQQIPERTTPEMLDTPPGSFNEWFNWSHDGSTETCNLLEVRWFSGEPFVKLLQFVYTPFAEVRSHQQHQKWVSNQVHVVSGRHNRQTFCWCLVPVSLSQVPGWKNAHEWSMTTTSCVGKMLVLHVETHCSNTTLSPPISADSISPFNTIRKHLNLTCMTHMTCITSKNCQQPWLSGVVGTSVFSLCAS